jgi:predicted esterase
MADDLIARCCSGQATREEVATLRARIAAEPALVAQLYATALAECELYEALAGATMVPAAEAAPERAVRERRAARPASLRLAPGRAHRALFRFAAAAAVLVGIFVWWLIAGPSIQAQPAAVAQEQPGAPPLRATPPAPLQPARIAPAPPVVAGGTSTPPPEAAAPEPAATAPPLLAQAPEAMAAAKTGGDEARVVAPPGTRKPLRVDAPLVASAHPRFDAKEGIYSEAADQPSVRYALHLPHELPTTPRLGLLVALHGAGGNEHWPGNSLAELIAARGGAGDYVVVGPKSQGRNWEPADEVPLLAFLVWLHRTYPIDARRIILVGVSNGGWMAQHLASHHPEAVAGIAALFGGGTTDLKKVANAAENGIEYYLAHGDADVDVPVKASRVVRDQLRALGYRYVYRELPGLPHGAPWDDPDVRADLAHWIDGVRVKPLPPTDDERKLLARFAHSDEQERLWADPAVLDELVRIGGPQAGFVVARALHQRPPAIRLAAAALTARSDFSGAVTASLAALLEDKDAALRHAAVVGLMGAAERGDAEAVVALCLFTGTRGHAREERLDALARLTGGFAFTRCAHFSEDAPVFETCIHLLEDEDAALRQAGAAALARGAPDGPAFPVEGAAAARRDAVLAWHRWYLKRFPANP